MVLVEPMTKKWAWVPRVLFSFSIETSSVNFGVLVGPMAKKWAWNPKVLFS